MSNLIESLIEETYIIRIAESSSEILDLNLEKASINSKSTINSIANLMVGRYKLLKILHTSTGGDKQVLQNTVNSIEKTLGEIRSRLPVDVYVAANDLATDRFYSTESKDSNGGDSVGESVVHKILDKLLLVNHC